MVRYGDAFHLFATLADGYWRSTDLAHWSFVKPGRGPLQGMVAPAIWSDRTRLSVMPSATEPTAILVSDDPASGRLEFLTRRTPALPGAVRPGGEEKVEPGQLPPGPWDPALFRDDDARWYLYWGSSNVFPLYGAEVGMGERFAYRLPIRPLVAPDPDRHGWERFGRDHSGTEDGKPIRPFIEGAWMTRAAGRYYLQYGAPGTEHNAYASGTYVADAPLGPFRYALYNPVAYKPGGFVEDAGHGSSFADAHGNWWNTGTAWIGANWRFERRVALFPARFHPDGQMAVSTRFGDLPHYVPGAAVADPDALFTGWMLLSYRTRAVASSTLGGFEAGRATDEDPRTFWVSATGAAGETPKLDLGRPDRLRAVQVNFADYRAGRFGDAPDIYAAFRIEASIDGRHWPTIADTDRRSARSAQRLSGFACAGTGALCPLCPRPRRRPPSGDRRLQGVRHRRRPRACGTAGCLRPARRRRTRRAGRVADGGGGGRLRRPLGIRPDRLT